MGGIITSLLTDVSARGNASLEAALIGQAEIAAPWGTKEVGE